MFRFWYAGQHDLVQDESYYWQWSRHLALGYYDNTPAMAFVIRFFTTILGTNEVGVRAGAIVSALVASLFIYLLARDMLGANIALLAVVMANIIPLFAAGAIIMTQDPVQLAFWSATIYVAWLAVKPAEALPPPGRGGIGDDGTPASAPSLQEGGRGVRYWLLAGVLAGLTAMSKLNGLLVLPSVLLYVCLVPTARHWLKHPAPYIASAIALALFTPFVWWNHTHENAFWIHIHAMGTRGDNGFTLRYLGEFLGAQAILVSPFIFLTYLAGLVRPTPALLYLWCMSVVVFAATLLLSLKSRVEGNWAVAAYVSGMILVATLMASQWRKPLGKVWHAISIFLALVLTLVVLFPDLGYAVGLRMGATNDRTNELYGWKRMAERVAQVQRQLGGPGKCFVFGVNYRMPSELAFYLPGHPQTYSLFLHDRYNEYMFWENESDLIGKNAVFVDDSPTPDHLADCRAVFARVVPQTPLYIYRRPYRQPIRVIQIFACYDFKGYDPRRWVKGW